ncbi:MAG: hypothetical protein WCQ53_02425 [bacterium]
MKTKTLFMGLIFIGLFACQSTNQQSSGTYEVSLGEADKQYVPKTSNQLDDPAYMKLINTLIEEKTATVTSDTEFLRIVKAIAWTESKWKHYYEENGKYYVFLGDQGHSFGMMQIYDTYHGQHPILQDNLEYGIAFAYEKYTRAQTNCDSGSNVGTDIASIARRTYAQYNGGNGAMCRNNDARDNNLENAYTDQPWLGYF